MNRPDSFDSIDDLLRDVLEALLTEGAPTSPSKGKAREIRGACLQLSNPLARLSRSEGRGKLFSALGELCWYLTGTDDVTQVSYYIPQYIESAENGKVHGAYGPRLLSYDGIDQMQEVSRLLSEKPDTRRAVVQLYDHRDLIGTHIDIPCTCTLQFLLRNGELDLVAHMRSNDAYLGLPHDIFAFTMLQEMMARKLGASLGAYIHLVGSLHLYDRNAVSARAFLDEGWQSNSPMPPMPDGDPWLHISELLEIEKRLRDGHDPVTVTLPKDPYWADLARLLVVFALYKTGQISEANDLRQHFSSNAYDLFIAEKTDPIN